MKKFILPLIFFFLIFSGCATVPTREGLQVYSLDGVSYVSLTALCQKKGITFDYDDYAKTATLTKDGHRINLMLGQNMVIVDGRMEHLRHPLDYYQGMIVAPLKFKEQILDGLFKDIATAQSAGGRWCHLKKIAIDAGHGGIDPGAMGRSGLKEKNVNLDIANRLAGILENEGLEVVRTRPNDRFVTLERRVDLANKSGADIFVSVHSNANRVRSLSGFEVYYISANVSDTKRALFSADNASLNISKDCFAQNSRDLKVILWDMIYTSNRAESKDLAQDILRTAKAGLEAKALGTKGAGFYVLKGTHMPAVLVEVGFVSNNNEERLLKDGSYRQAIAQAIANGIRAYDREYMFAEVQN